MRVSPVPFIYRICLILIFYNNAVVHNDVALMSIRASKERRGLFGMYLLTPGKDPFGTERCSKQMFVHRHLHNTCLDTNLTQAEFATQDRV